MKIKRTTISKLGASLPKIFVDQFSYDIDTSNDIYEVYLKPYLKGIKPDIKLLIEYDYVDKIYRDSYYHYYSTKLYPYKKNCIKISLFEKGGNITANGLWNEKNIEILQDKYYLGFFIIRPTIPQVFGRSVISPKAFIDNNIKTCSVEIPTTAGGVKFYATGFPHSSQDKETMQCGETTIWALMEYFGNKYSEYNTLLPTTVRKILKTVSYERQLPTSGLAVNAITYVLKKIGFGVKTFSLKSYHDLENILSCYIESGIPVIVALNNFDAFDKQNSIIEDLKEEKEDVSEDEIINELKKSGFDEKITRAAHTVICIGYENEAEATEKMEFQSLINPDTMDTVNFFDYDNKKRNFVFIDDNCHAYTKASLEKPTEHYPKGNLKYSTISHIITPIHHRVYLDANVAKSFIKGYITRKEFGIAVDAKVILKTFLASSRTYRDHVAKCTKLPKKVKKFILEQVLPRFTWITEIYSENDLNMQDPIGLIVLDPTEAIIHNLEPLVFSIYATNCEVFNKKNHKIENKSRVLFENNVPLPPFTPFDKNVK